MLVSLNWLNEYIDVSDLSPEQIGETLTSIGHEVEGIEESESLDAKVIVGKVIEANQHPNADSLRVCKVDAGDGGDPLQVVCGAPNARAGIKVALAQVGAKFGDFKIKKSKIRGEASFGMMCSGEELGLSDGFVDWWQAQVNSGPVKRFSNFLRDDFNALIACFPSVTI